MAYARKVFSEPKQLLYELDTSHAPESPMLCNRC